MLFKAGMRLAIRDTRTFVSVDSDMLLPPSVIVVNADEETVRWRSGVLKPTAAVDCRTSITLRTISLSLRLAGAGCASEDEVAPSDKDVATETVEVDRGIMFGSFSATSVN